MKYYECKAGRLTSFLIKTIYLLRSEFTYLHGTSLNELHDYPTPLALQILQSFNVVIHTQYMTLSLESICIGSETFHLDTEKVN